MNEVWLDRFISVLTFTGMIATLVALVSSVDIWLAVSACCFSLAFLVTSNRLRLLRERYEALERERPKWRLFL